MAPQWQLLNFPSSSPIPTPDSSQSFTLTAPPKTDIWKPDTKTHVFDAPFYYQAIESSSFHSLTLTVSASWKTLYDQGGLMLAWPGKSSAAPEGGAGVKPEKWVKAGIEVFDGKPHLGVVGTDRFSDWSLAGMEREGDQEARFEAVREGTTLWVYLVRTDGKRQALREIKWAFLEEREGEAELWVGTYAAKPTPDQGNEEAGIEVTFRNVEVKSR